MIVVAGTCALADVAWEPKTAALRVAEAIPKPRWINLVFICGMCFGFRVKIDWIGFIVLLLLFRDLFSMRGVLRQERRASSVASLRVIYGSQYCLRRWPRLDPRCRKLQADCHKRWHRGWTCPTP